MCDKVRGYLATFREYKAELVMVLGFGLAGVLYCDMRTFTEAVVEQQRQTAEILSKVEARLQHLEATVEGLKTHSEP